MKKKKQIFKCPGCGQEFLKPVGGNGFCKSCGKSWRTEELLDENGKVIRNYMPPGLWDTWGVVYMINRYSEWLADEKERKRFLFSLCFDKAMSEHGFYFQTCIDTMMQKGLKSIEEGEAFDKTEFKELIKKELGL